MLKKVAILGATGAVGRQMLECLIERNFPCEIKCLASARSAGKEIQCLGRKFIVEEATRDSFAGMDIVLGAASASLAREFAPYITAAGAVFVDNSSAFRLEKDVPLVVPEINPEDVKLHHGIISNPNCSTIITMVARSRPFQNFAHPPSGGFHVSGSFRRGGGRSGGIGKPGAGLRRGKELKIAQFKHQIAFNLIPQIGTDSGNGYTTEEMKMQNEGRKILHLPEMKVTCTCVRVPVMRSHSISVSLETQRKISVEEARSAIAAAPGCRLVDDLAHDVYPMPLDTSNQDTVFVGRIRDDLVFENGLALWCCGDQIRKGAATNTVQIAELLL